VNIVGMLNKVAVVGVGAGACAFALMLRGSAREIVLVDGTAERAAGVATGMRYALPLSPTKEISSGDFTDLAGAGVVRAGAVVVRLSAVSRGAQLAAPMAVAEPSAREPTAAAVSFVTTEHFALQGARSQTVAEATGRASIFLASVSGGLVALGLMATAAHIGTAFYAVALTLLPTLAFVGLVTFHRVVQNRLEDLNYANRIAGLRAFYFELAPELDAYLLSVPPEGRLIIQGLPEGFWQNFVTIAGMIAVITSVLVGASVALLVAIVANHSLAAALAAGGPVTIAALVAMMRHQYSAGTQLWQPAVESLP
jgi:hypothetical protein